MLGVADEEGVEREAPAEVDGIAEEEARAGVES